ncbi:tail fiber protein [Proteus mirabilis]|nr:tail fiber protein [Proteus mirabilis]
MKSDINDANNIPVGSPIPWPLPKPPVGYLACNGQTFNKKTYPKLAIAYPSGKLPDLRGEFIRGFDDGRGVDSGRIILSPQTGNSLLSGTGHGFYNYEAKGYVEKFYGGFNSGSNNQQDQAMWQQIEGKNNNETRPRNISFLYIVRAA